jgi:ABC-type oligopeptide transport system substrate-binding subunit
MNRPLTAAAACALVLLAGCSTSSSGTATPATSSVSVVEPVEDVTPGALPPTVKTADQTCREITDMYDGLAAFGETDRRAAVEELMAEMMASAEWAVTPPEEQAEIMRGMEAAASQSC